MTSMVLNSCIEVCIVEFHFFASRLYALTCIQFFFAASGSARLKEFGEELGGVIKSISPNKTPIHLVLDGLSDEAGDEASSGYSGYRIGPAPLEVCRGLFFNYFNYNFAGLARCSLYCSFLSLTHCNRSHCLWNNSPFELKLLPYARFLTVLCGRAECPNGFFITRTK